jgi:hypothetical protein
MFRFFRHPGEGRDPRSLQAPRSSPDETPAFAGVTVA